ncbi:VOC family protein [Catenulispora pinisilvae]|uniref:VOC family protein n=1 Tax=Catenulispora pinisilvae TaxID=2705253 RepID=UPI001891A484|nr:VOC family protein [Catenulispora pinisilvae]
MGARIKDVIVDCRDPEALGAFWAAVLDRPIAARIGPFVWLTRGDGPGLGFQKADGAKAGKNRVHFDVGSPDPAAERARLEALGARHLPEYAAGGFLVMADPEGNEFCVIPEGPFELDDEGRASYLEFGA